MKRHSRHKKVQCKDSNEVLTRKGFHQERVHPAATVEQGVIVTDVEG